MTASPPAAGRVVVLGRFPPPFDGQTVSTRQLADLLAPAYAVQRQNVGFVEPRDRVQTDARWRMDRVRHYLGHRRTVHHALRDAPGVPVLWASVSPSLLGHARDLLATLPALRHDQPLVAVVHRGNFDLLFTHPVTRHTARTLVRRVDRFVFLSESLSRACAPFLPEAKRAVIPNTIERALQPSASALAAKRAAFDADRSFRLLYAGLMTPSKGFMAVLRAVAQLHAAGVPVAAKLVGAWPSQAERHDVEAFVAREKLGDVVDVLGPVYERDALGRLYLWADALAFPTRYPTEAQPMVVVEALAAGTPCIVTRHASLPTMLGDTTAASSGFFVDGDPQGDDHAALAQQIADAVRTLREPTQWHAASRAAEQRYHAHFADAIVRERWVQLVESLRADSSPTA